MKVKNITEKQNIYQALLQSATDYVVAINRNYQILMANELFKNEFNAPAGGLCYKVWTKKETNGATIVWSKRPLRTDLDTGA